MATIIDQRPAAVPPMADEGFGLARSSAPVRRRAAAIYAAMVVAGLIPTLAGLAPGFQAFGLGMLFPGAGFFAVGGWALLAVPLILVLMLAACALWQLTANVALPMAIWAVSALVAALTVGTAVPAWAAPAALGWAAAFLAVCTVIAKRHLAAEAERGAARATWLPTEIAALHARAEAAPAPGTREIAAEDLKSLRYALDRGLQPVDQFNGFNIIEQFQTSGLRYQINNLLWALQIAQCHYTPNFHGYLSRAQTNLMDKITVPIVWTWWRWENLWGNFSFNVDPVAKDNIMTGGFFSTYVAQYTANTGDRRYLEAGAFTFRWNARKAFRHNLQSMLEAGRTNHRIATYGPLYPCEPKLTYSACNLWGNFSHLISDRIFDTNYAEGLLPKLREGHVGEMCGLDGSPHAGRIEPLGIRIPVYACNFVSAFWGWMASAFFPDLSERTWAVLRRECVSFDAQGEIRLATLAYDRVDTGNYRKSEIGLYANFLILAREHGDSEVAEAIVRAIDARFGRDEADGSVAYTEGSTTNNALVVMGRLMRRHDLRRMTWEGPARSALAGPVLTGASYPDILVAKAFSDGTDLQLVLHPGRAAGPQRLTVERLAPDADYVAEPQGVMIRADAAGIAHFDLIVDGRTETRLRRA